MLASWEDGVSERVVIMGMSLETGRPLFWFQKEERDFSKEVRLACWEGSKIFSQGKHYFHIEVFLTKSFCFSLEKCESADVRWSQTPGSGPCRPVARVPVVRTQTWKHVVPGWVRRLQPRRDCHLDVFLKVQCFGETLKSVKKCFEKCWL